jgi:hypothetical protein
MVTPYVLSSAISMVVSLKEHKFQFQFSTNTHAELARTMFFSYVAMVLISVVTIHFAGVDGFLWTWLVVESLQVVRLISMNRRLFANAQPIKTGAILRLVLLCGAGLLAAVALLPHSSTLSLPTQTAFAAIGSAVVGAMAWKLFGVREVYANMMERLGGRFA